MYHRIILVFFAALFTVVYFPAAVIGQSTDSLLFILDNNLVKDDAEKYELLCLIIRETTDVESKMQFCDQAIELAQKLKILPDKPYVFKGIIYLDSSKLESALDNFFKAANYYKENTDSGGLAGAYLYIAETYNQQENYDNEKKYLQYAIEIYKIIIRVLY